MTSEEEFLAKSADEFKEFRLAEVLKRQQEMAEPVKEAQQRQGKMPTDELKNQWASATALILRMSQITGKSPNELLGREPCT